MIGATKSYLKALEKGLAHHPDRQSILDDYEDHLESLVKESETNGLSDKEWVDLIEERLGRPEDIVSMWLEEAALTPEKTKWTFFIINLGLFIGGGFLTVAYNVMHWSWINQVWVVLTSIPFIIICLYLLFWILLGYEIGKEFGYKGRELLKRTFLISLIPNIILMILILLHIIPVEWFKPILSVPFILLCIVLTGLLYPISYLGYRWGRKASL